MNPSGINSFDPNFVKVTFTLANAVPQFAASNNGPWEKFEKKNKKLYQNYLWEPNPPGNPLPTDRQIRKWPQWRTEAARYEHIYSDEQ